ncbi:glycosyltransferase family 2 protein [Rhodococcoides yunnanense]|uniref:glycosyltransferase family 2 protein n=1 Tax=Rhodococcoides yunnanense TaxID=278209 RepID=UPI0009333F63|nr:glycosyltransferase family 2 protein [Rhodococcus yunnanensis]
MPLPTLSVIVPVYNEENYIGPCIAALLEQSADIDEIIVVDNGSTDSTLDILEKIGAGSPQVRILHETRRGVAHARNTGFEAASAAILGRVDADTRVSPGWARSVTEYFGRDDTAQVGAVSGLNNSYDSPFRSLKGWFVRKQISRGMFGGERRMKNLHGANMALRKSTWAEVADRVSVQPDIHEDLDLALCIVAKDIEIAQLTEMHVNISPRRALTPPIEFYKYIDSGTKTFELHGRMNKTIARWLRIHWAFHILLFVLHRPYDPSTGRYSIKYLLTQERARGLPIDVAR